MIVVPGQATTTKARRVRRDNLVYGHLRSLWQSCLMRAEDVTVEELEAFWDRLQGPLGAALRMAGEIMAQRLAARGQEVSDLSDDAMLELLYSAFREAAPSYYTDVDRVAVDDALDKMGEALSAARMDLAGNSVSTGAIN